MQYQMRQYVDPDTQEERPWSQVVWDRLLDGDEVQVDALADEIYGVCDSITKQRARSLILSLRHRIERKTLRTLFCRQEIEKGVFGIYALSVGSSGKHGVSQENIKRTKAYLSRTKTLVRGLTSTLNQYPTLIPEIFPRIESLFIAASQSKARLEYLTEQRQGNDQQQPKKLGSGDMDYAIKVIVEEESKLKGK